MTMSSDPTSPASTTSPEDAWAGKSRNAKAQARHRAKRKAYIEQLEQTVAKLQTALALSPEDVGNLPSAQMKLGELKGENDSLRAELQKLRSLHYHPYGMQSGASRTSVSSDDYPRHSKRRRTTTHELPPRNLYLGASENSVNHYPFAPRLITPFSSTTASMPSPVSPIEGTPTGISWMPFNHSAPQVHSPMWAEATHPRSRTSSSSSSSSETSPVLLASLFPSSSPKLASPHWLRSEPSRQNSIDPSNVSFSLGLTDTDGYANGGLSYTL